MQTISRSPEVDMHTLIALSSQIARRGYGEPVIELALRRKGLSKDAARLIAASAVGCRAAIVAARSPAESSNGRDIVARGASRTDRRTARAASLALSKISNFFLLAILGFGSGVFLGWSVGFNRGMEDGFEWIARLIERLFAG